MAHSRNKLVKVELDQLTLRWKVIFSYISPEDEVPSADEFEDDSRSVSVPFLELA